MLSTCHVRTPSLDAETGIYVCTPVFGVVFMVTIFLFLVRVAGGKYGVGARVPFVWDFSLILSWAQSTVFSDPGIITRNPKADFQPRPPRLQVRIVLLFGPCPVLLKRTHTSCDLVFGVQVVSGSGKLSDLSFCETCGVFRPSHAEHCYTCDNCVMR